MPVLSRGYTALDPVKKLICIELLYVSEQEKNNSCNLIFFTRAQRSAVESLCLHVSSIKMVGRRLPEVD